MTESPDSELLSHYCRTGAEQSFGILVKRHVDLVFSTALRGSHGNQELAKDVCQDVFILLAKEANNLQNRRSLVGWLYLTTRFKARNAVRGEVRRQGRECELTQLSEFAANQSKQSDMNDLESIMDEALQTIDEQDREAVLLRVVNQQEYQQLGKTLGLSEDAARKRVNRALERIRQRLEQRGIRSSIRGLALALAAFTNIDAPPGLAQTVTTAAITTASSLRPVSGSLALISSTQSIATSFGLVGMILVLGVAIIIGVQLPNSVHPKKQDPAVGNDTRAAAVEDEITRRKWTLITGNPSEMADPEVQRLELLRLREQLGAMQSKSHRIDGDRTKQRP